MLRERRGLFLSTWTTKISSGFGDVAERFTRPLPQAPVGRRHVRRDRRRMRCRIPCLQPDGYNLVLVFSKSGGPSTGPWSGPPMFVELEATCRIEDAGMPGMPPNHAGNFGYLYMVFLRRDIEPSR